MFKHKKLILFLLVVPLCALGLTLWYFYDTQIIRLDYEGFTVWLDCSRRGAVKFRYIAQPDTGKLDRLHMFSIDSNVPYRCQQTATAPYTHPNVRYDRGHLVPANHFDHSEKALKQSNFVTNTLPQVAEMNRGAWLGTEQLIECYRDITRLIVVGGVIWGNDASDDYFLQSHGVATPDAFWKVVVSKEYGVLAWVIPNSKQAIYSRVDSYLVSVAEVERRTRETVSDVPKELKHFKAEVSWPKVKGCSRQ